MTKKYVLHVGCGPYNPKKLPARFRSDEWQEIRLDIDPQVRPDIVASITDMGGIRSGSFDALFSSHNIEHLYPHEVDTALSEFARVLKPDGFALITCPDLQTVAEYIAEDKLDETLYTSPAGPIAPVDILYGHRPSLAKGNLFMAHKMGFTAKTLGQALVRNGFAQVKVRRDREHYNLWAVGRL
jgi:ubiquinone/menaquinone biosynthesis C-methylase UbiE